MCRGWWVVISLLAGCAQPPAAASVQPVARWATGSVSKQEVDVYAKQLPPALQHQLETDTGYRSFVASVVDKKLLAEEARRQGLDASEDVQRQVDELRQRLAIQALLAKAERSLPAPSETQLREYYEANRESFGVPVRVRLGRVSTAPANAQAKSRLLALVARLSKEPLETVAASGDGPERFTRGDVGWVDTPDSGEAKAGLALTKVGERSAPIQSAQGWSVMVLLERREANVPSFEEVKTKVAGRIGPSQQRKSFEVLLESLRAKAKVEINAL